jgi:aspartate/tyrosine/aromatic aminotransferase
VSISTAWRDWKVINAWNEEDWARDRENMLSRLQQMRSKLFHQALKKGQLQTAAQVLDSLGRVIGEAAPEQIAVSAPNLQIQIESKNS